MALQLESAISYLPASISVSDVTGQNSTNHEANKHHLTETCSQSVMDSINSKRSFSHCLTEQSVRKSNLHNAGWNNSLLMLSRYSGVLKTMNMIVKLCPKAFEAVMRNCSFGHMLNKTSFRHRHWMNEHVLSVLIMESWKHQMLWISNKRGLRWTNCPVGKWCMLNISLTVIRFIAGRRAFWENVTETADMFTLVARPPLSYSYQYLIIIHISFNSAIPS